MNQCYAIQAWEVKEGWQTLSTCEDLDPLIATYHETVHDLKLGKLPGIDRLRLIIILMEFEDRSID